MIPSTLRTRAQRFALTLIVLAWAIFIADSAAAGGAVSSATPEATQAGIETLLGGGNAVDSAVAVAFALGVTEPAMSGLGGQVQMLVHPANAEPYVINGTSFAPGELPSHVQREDLVGRRATTVPSAVKVLAFAHRHAGSGRVTWADLIRPAIRFAEDGFVVGPFRQKVWAHHVEQLRLDSGARKYFLKPDGSAPAQGETWRQPALAKTLRRLSNEGDDGFYSGRMAREIARDMRRGGGWISASDLAALKEPNLLEPLHGTYRGFDVYTLPPPGGGWVVLQALKVLEMSEPAQLEMGSETELQRLAQALLIAHRSRRDAPVEDLVDYENEVRTRISEGTAVQLLEAERGETTHFSVVDDEGNAVSVTASINAYFGGRSAHPELGFLYNSYMHEFELDAKAHPFALRPGAMPYSSMAPTIVARDGSPVLVLGSPGSARIISAIVQVIHFWVDAKLRIESAVDASRIHVTPDRVIYLEDATARARYVDMLTAMGYEPREAYDAVALGPLNAYFGGVHAVAREEGSWRGAADPRRDGVAETSVTMENVQ